MSGAVLPPGLADRVSVMEKISSALGRPAPGPEADSWL